MIKILSALDVHGDLERLAKRGARYGFPGWVGEESTKTGKVKRSYLEGPEAEAKAREYLAGAKTAAELAGRQLALVVMARMADERAVAQSRRASYEVSVSASHSDYSVYGPPAGVPWAAEVLAVLDELAVARLPERLTEGLRERMEREATERAEREAQQARYGHLLAQLPAMTAEQRGAALDEAETEFGISPWSAAYHRLAQAITAADRASLSADGPARPSRAPDQRG